MTKYVALFSLAILSCLSVGRTQGAETDVRCGSRCLYVALKSLNLPVESTVQLEGLMGDPFPSGYSLAELAAAAETCGARTLGVKTTFENLQKRPGRFACIAFVGGDHFVLFGDVKDQMVTYVDPPRMTTLPTATVLNEWQGEALLISPEAILPEESLPGNRTGWINALIIALAVVAVTFTVQLYRKRQSQ